MGPIPLLSDTGLTDLTFTLVPADNKAISRSLKAFQRRFPQCHLHIVVNRFVDTFPPSCLLFWLFNSAGLSGVECRRGHNRDVLIGIDPAACWTGLIIGYGLEPFLGQEALDQILDHSVPRLEAGHTGAAIIGMISRLGELMEGVCRDIPATLGLGHNLAVKSGSNDF